MYNQTIIQATLVDELESLLIFMEELIKKHKGDKTAEDRYAFQQMSDVDRERVGEVLQKVGISYPERRWSDEPLDREDQEEESKQNQGG